MGYVGEKGRSCKKIRLEVLTRGCKSDCRIPDIFCDLVFFLRGSQLSFLGGVLYG